MKKTHYKLFWLWDFEKEEKWLNGMAAKGWHLCNVGFCRYVFEEGAPNAYTYRLELLDNAPGHSESARYIRFVEDTGAEYVGALFRWVYFRKKAGEGGFDLFSDLESRIRHLNRILPLAAVFFCLNLFNGFGQLSSWAAERDSASLIIGLSCTAIGLLIGYGCFRLWREKRRLQREQILHE